MIGVRVAAAAAAALAVFAPWPSGAGAQVPSGEVVFTSEGSLTHFELFALKVFTDEPVAVAPPIMPLTQNAADSESLSPAYSPDGRRIYFGSNRENSFQVWEMGFDGSNPMPMTNQPGGASEPSPFPSGDRIAYSCAVGLDAEICTSDLATGAVTPLTNNTMPDNHADVSPDGQRIVWQQGSPPEICTMDADGQNQTCLTNDSVPDTMPQWDPDGQTIIWAKGQPPNGNLMRMNSDGSNPTQLTTGDTDSNPVPLPGAVNRIVFIRMTTGGPRLFIAGANGENPGPLNGQDITVAPAGGLDVRPADPPEIDATIARAVRSLTRLSLRLTSDQRAQLSISAIVKLVAEGGRSSSALASAKKLRFKPTAVEVAANGSTKVTLKASKRAKKALVNATKSGEKLKVTVTVTATNELGDVSDITEKGKVKPKK